MVCVVVVWSRKVRTITLSNRRETSWLPLVRANELKDGEDVIQVTATLTLLILFDFFFRYFAGTRGVSIPL